jgi:serine/threonine-protein kinase
MTTEVLSVEEIQFLDNQDREGRPPIHIGPYQVLRRISAGGMAEVFAARRDFGLGVRRLVAVKRLLPHLARDPEHVRMFIEEARLSGSLSHGNIPHFFEFGLVDDQYFLVMDLVDGPDLEWIRAAVTRRRMSIPVPIAIHVTTAVCDALAYLHGKKSGDGQPLGIVHRDVTPANILLSSSGDVKLIDFGIVKSWRRAWETTGGRIKGKASYLSPEQIRGSRAIDGRSDVFSLGIVLHELLVGRSLFAGATVSESIHQVLIRPIPPASHLNPRVPARLDAIVARCLRRDPELRYQRMQELHEDLEQLRRSSKAHIGSGQVRRWLTQVRSGGSSFHRRWPRRPACFDDDTPFVGRPPRELLDRCRHVPDLALDTCTCGDSEDTAILHAFIDPLRLRLPRARVRSPGLTTETLDELTTRSPSRLLLLLLLLSFALCTTAVLLVLQELT